MTPNLETNNASLRSATLMTMVADDDWGLPCDARRKVVAMFADVEAPRGVGTAEIADLMREFHFEIRAYEDFCEYRERKHQSLGREVSIVVTRDEWLDAKRAELRRPRAGLRRRLRSLFG